MKRLRRAVLSSAIAAGIFAGMMGSHAQAQDWRAQYREIEFAVIPAENAEGVVGRYGPMMAHLSKELGVPVKLRIVNDYAAVIEGHRSGQIHVALYGPASFARALKIGVKVEAFAQTVNEDGARGYYSVFYVRADSPYKSIQDLKGKNLGLVDPNSTSGYIVPLHALDKLSIDPNSFFSKTLMTGSHENAVMALQQGMVDVAANSWTDENVSQLRRMALKKMVKAEDFRIILKSDLIVNSPLAYRSDFPAEMKTAIAAAFLEAPTKAPEAFRRITDGRDRPWAPVGNEAYQPILELINFIDALKKKSN
jgi:phosphonate transport system substrate-binding protein